MSLQPSGSSAEESAALMCALCKENFSSSWDLMVHAQAAHMVNIYQLSTKDVPSSVSNEITYPCSYLYKLLHVNNINLTIRNETKKSG